MILRIDNFDGYYISNSGKVYCDLGKGNRDKSKRVELYEIKPRLTKNGYSRIYARNSITGKRQDLYIHRLVAKNFVYNDDPKNKKYVNHKDCIRNHNESCNLEFCTAKENNKQTIEMHHIIRNNKGQFVSNYDFKKDLI